MAQAPAKTDPAAKPPKPRRCAKCATPAAESDFKIEAGQSPYCASCRGHFPSLQAAGLVLTQPRKPRR